MAEDYNLSMDEGGEGGPATPPPKASGGSGIVTALKIFSIVSGVLTLLMIFLMYQGRPESDEAMVFGLTDADLFMLGLAMGVVGMVFGSIAVFVGPRRLSENKVIPPLNSIMLGIGAIGFLVGGAMVVYNDPRYAEVTNLTWDKVAYIMLYAWFLLWYVELGSTSMRYAVVDDYIRKHGITDFSLTPVVSTYLGWFFLLMMVILGWSYTVIVLTPAALVGLTASYGYEQLADSVMFNSVYSVAISMALWFVLIALVLTIVYGFFVKDTRKEVIQTKKEGEEF